MLDKKPQSTETSAALAYLRADRPSGMQWPTSIDSNHTSRDVLDQVIATLRESLVRAVAEDGNDSPRAKNLRAALSAAYEQRSGMIFLRPTSAYLRTSYAVSALGDNAGVKWENLLEDSIGAMVPLIDESLINGTDERLKTRERIDAQFWQSINHVRVTGGGWTNYVVTKDDIGNWYVKGFSNNPEAIIRSAKQLAQFNASPARAALLGGPGTAQAKLSTGATSSGGGGTILEGQLDRARTAYESATRELRKDVVDNLAKPIVNDVKTSWLADRSLDLERTNLEQALDTAAKAQLVTAQKDPPTSESVAAAADAILDGLFAVKRFRTAALAEIDATVVGPHQTVVAAAHKTTLEKEARLAASQDEAFKAYRAVPDPFPQPDTRGGSSTTRRRRSRPCSRRTRMSS